MSSASNYAIGGVLAGLGNGAVNYFSQKDRLAADEVRDQRADARMRWMTDRQMEAQAAASDVHFQELKATLQANKEIAAGNNSTQVAVADKQAGATIEGSKIQAKGAVDAATIQGDNAVKVVNATADAGTKALKDKIGILSSMGDGKASDPVQTQMIYDTLGIKRSEYDLKVVAGADMSERLIAVNKNNINDVKDVTDAAKAIVTPQYSKDTPISLGSDVSGYFNSFINNPIGSGGANRNNMNKNGTQ
jgi:hypothetical protein